MLRASRAAALACDLKPWPSGSAVEISPKYVLSVFERLTVSSPRYTVLSTHYLVPKSETSAHLLNSPKQQPLTCLPLSLSPPLPLSHSTLPRPPSRSE